MGGVADVRPGWSAGRSTSRRDEPAAAERIEPTMTFHVHPLLADLYLKQQAAENRRRFERGRSDRRSGVRQRPIPRRAD
jgi:hypothetical protein